MVKWLLLETFQQISVKFGLYSFQVRFVIPFNFGLGLLSAFGGVADNKEKKIRKKQSENTKPLVTTYERTKYIRLFTTQVVQMK